MYEMAHAWRWPCCGRLFARVAIEDWEAVRCCSFTKQKTVTSCCVDFDDDEDDENVVVDGSGYGVAVNRKPGKKGLGCNASIPV